MDLRRDSSAAQGCAGWLGLSEALVWSRALLFGFRRSFEALGRAGFGFGTAFFSKNGYEFRTFFESTLRNGFESRTFFESELWTGFEFRTFFEPDLRNGFEFRSVFELRNTCTRSGL